MAHAKPNKMHEENFDEAIELIRLKDPRYRREAYQFVRESLDHTQKMISRENHGKLRHVTGQELLGGIRDFALNQFGPMAITVLEEWGIQSCEDFGEIVFNMIEGCGSSKFARGDIKNFNGLVSKLTQGDDPLSSFLWNALSEERRAKLQADGDEVLGEALLIEELNRIISSGPIYNEARFSRVLLSRQAKSLIPHELAGEQLARLNRLLLEEAYPDEVARAGILAKTETDTRADFADGYVFKDAFQKPFLPSSKLSASEPATLSQREN